MAAKGGYKDTVEYLVKEGARINRKDRLKVSNFDGTLFLSILQVLKELHASQQLYMYSF